MPICPRFVIGQVQDIVVELNID